MDKVPGGAFKLNTGYYMPMMGYGSMILRESKESAWGFTITTDLDIVTKSLDAVLSAGYRLIDTALIYGNEQHIGTALKELLPKHNLKREDVFITTKVMPQSEEATRAAILDSIQKLQLDYVDLVLVHYPKSFLSGKADDDPTNKDDRKTSYVALDKLKGEGKIRSIGVSNWEPHHIEEIAAYSSTPPAVDQLELSPYFTRDHLYKYLKEKGIFFQAFSSLGQTKCKELLAEPVVTAMAKAKNATPGQVVLAFALCQGVGVIPKSEKPERIKQNFDSINVKLTAAEIAQLAALNKGQPCSPCTGWLVK